MSDIIKFVKLEINTFKSVVGVNKILILFVLMIVVYFTGGVGSLVIMLPMFLSMLVTQNFVAGNDGLDIFYASLHLKRNYVVLGRYAFIILVNMLVLILLFILSFFEGGYLNPQLFLMQVLSVLFVSTMLSFLSVPLLFKLGFKKGNIVAQSLPILLLIGMIIYVNVVDSAFNEGVALITYNLQGVQISPFVIFAVWVVLLSTSVFFSLKFYLNREL